MIEAGFDGGDRGPSAWEVEQLLPEHFAVGDTGAPRSVTGEITPEASQRAGKIDCHPEIGADASGLDAEFYDQRLEG